MYGYGVVVVVVVVRQSVCPVAQYGLVSGSPHGHDELQPFDVWNQYHVLPDGTPIQSHPSVHPADHVVVVVVVVLQSHVVVVVEVVVVAGSGVVVVVVLHTGG